MLRAGLIGLGRMGLTHLAILNTHPDVTFVGVCDSSKFLLDRLTSLMAVRGFQDHRKMLDSCDLDFVIVATPPDHHAEAVRRAISRSLHLFVEKPLSLSEKDSMEIVDMLKRTRLVNQVGYVNRFNAVFSEVKRILTNGLLGDLRHLKSEMYGGTVLRDLPKTWRTQTRRGGGCLHEFASHCIDLVHYLIGPPDRVVGSVMQSVYSSQAEDAVYSTFLYDSGVTAVIQVNWSDASCRKPTNRLEAFGTKGKLIADKYALKVFLRDPDESRVYDKGWNVRYATDLAKPVRFYLRGNEFTAQLDHFVQCIQEGRASGACTCDDALKTDRVIEAIIRESRQRETVNG